MTLETVDIDTPLRRAASAIVDDENLSVVVRRESSELRVASPTDIEHSLTVGSR
jgi:hypothetical protein